MVDLGPALDLSRWQLDVVHEGTCLVVARGTEPRTRRPVAVRTPRSGAELGAQRLAAAVTVEASVGRHARLAPVLLAGGRGGGCALVTPWYPATLTELPGPHGVPAVAARGTALATALVALHGAGLVHGEIDPNAVFVDEDGAPVLGRLHACRPPGPRSRLRLSACTAPEALRGADVAAAEDVYALAAVLVHALTGEPLLHRWPGEADAGFALRLLGVDPSPRPSWGGLAPVLTRCLDPDPGRRPSAAELAAQLVRWAAVRGRPG
ncbi:MAG: hypothetical protein U0Q15_18290 [Kineosporiaceae bacterium]